MKFVYSLPLFGALLGAALQAAAPAKSFIEYFLPIPAQSPLTKDTWGAPGTLPRDTRNGLEDVANRYCYWDGQILRGPDGKYRLFASRWDEPKGHNGWLGSVAVSGISDHLLGPYVDRGPCWPDNQEGKGHNVTALQLPDGRYAIVVSETRQGDVFVSDSLDGPWSHLGSIVTHGDVRKRASNYSVMVRPDGDFQIVPRSGQILISKNGILGPYQAQGPSIYPQIAGLEQRDLEDPVIWYSGGRYHIIVNSWSQRKAYHLTSRDGITGWTLRGLAYDPSVDFVRYTDGTVNRWEKLERPGVVLENGHVVAVTLAVLDVPKDQEKGNDRHGNKVIVIPFDGAALDRDLAGVPELPSTTPGAETPAAVLPNPLILQRADPHITRHTDGFYYFMGTVPEYDRLELRRAESIAGLGTAEPKVIWRKHATGVMGAHIWAPELHFIDGKWYIYFAAGEAEKVWNIRIYVLENSAANPLEGEWIERGQLKTRWESFALDATTFALHGNRYLVWAQRDPAVKNNTDLYIAKMDSPVSITGPQVLLSRPEFDWEKVRYAVNEGPAVLIRNGRVIVTYSAAGTGPEYCLGLLTADEHADPLDPASWTKSSTPVFTTSEPNHIFGPGHNSFTTALDGTDLLVYHARNYAEIKGDPLKDPNRHTRIQPIAWRADGTPDFGTPQPETPIFRGPRAYGPVKREELYARDACIWPDPATQTYTMYFASRGPNRRAAVVAYTSKDLETWTGPTVVFERPAEWWADRGIWAPEMHAYQGKYYLFLTFDSTHEFPEQWRNWLPRVRRGSQVLVADSPLGPFQPFANAPTLPADMMTLDGTLWVEDGKPYMVFCHEWVQIKDGTVEYVPLKDDLSATAGEPQRLFNGSDAPWSKKSEQYGCHVTDGPWLYRTRGGKLLMLWSSGSTTGYAVGIATSDSGKLAGPWRQAQTALYDDDGGHPMLFHTFDGRLMMALHRPNRTPRAIREVFLELEEVNDTLVLKRAQPPTP